MNIFSTICRSCLALNRDVINLYSPFNVGSNASSKSSHNLTFSECFKIITNIKIEHNDNMPQTICEQCMKELKIAYTFRKKCENSDQKLKGQLRKVIKTERKVELEPDVNEYGIVDILDEQPVDAEEPALPEEDVQLVEISDHNLGDQVIEIEYEEEIANATPPQQLQQSQKSVITKVRRTTKSRLNQLIRNATEEFPIETNLKQENSFIDDQSVNEELIIDDENESKTDQFVIYEPNEASSNFVEYEITDEANEVEETFDGEYVTEEDEEEHIISDTLDPRPDESVVLVPHDEDILEVKEATYFQCEICLQKLKNKQILLKHMETSHNGKTVHLCNFCGKLCSTETTLKAHLLLHQSNRPFKCDHCDKTYTSKNGLQNHHLISHANKKPDAKFLCSICGKGFTTNQRLRIHTFTHTGERNYSCELCEKSFATEFRLRSHHRIHTGERPYECLECGLTFAQGNALKCHKRVHTGEKPYACKFCGKCFSQNTILKTHMTLHTGKNVKCPDCDKKFSRASYLILHRREHTGEKPYVCDRCPNRYKQKSHLDRHMDTHLGVKHKCYVCNKEYSKQWSLKMHMFTHSDDKPFTCHECNVSFVRRDKYKAHLKVYHGRDLLPEENRYVNMAEDKSVEYVHYEEVDATSTPPTVTTIISAKTKSSPGGGPTTVVN